MACRGVDGDCTTFGHLKQMLSLKSHNPASVKQRCPGINEHTRRLIRETRTQYKNIERKRSSRSPNPQTPRIDAGRSTGRDLVQTG